MKENRPAKEGKAQIFTRKLQESQCLTCQLQCSTVIFAKLSQPFTDGDLVKECNQSICTEICPENQGYLTKSQCQG